MLLRLELRKHRHLKEFLRARALTQLHHGECRSFRLESALQLHRYFLQESVLPFLWCDVGGESMTYHRKP